MHAPCKGWRELLEALDQAGSQFRADLLRAIRAGLLLSRLMTRHFIGTRHVLVRNM